MAVVVLVSLLVHAALLLLPLPGPREETPPPEAPTMRVDLLPKPVTPPSEASQPRPEPEREQRRKAEDREEARHPPEQAERRSASHDAGDQTESARRTPDSRTSPPPNRLRTQLLGAARQLGRESEQIEKGDGLSYHETPDLPSRPGWLNQHTGRVTASVHHWRDNDGSRNSRIVMGSGQVVCVRTRAPTIDEVFNPWMSSAVPMMRDCGRERPDAPDGTDPWLRRPDADGE